MTLTSVPQHLVFCVLDGSCDVIIHPREHRDNALSLRVVYFQTRRSGVTAKCTAWPKKMAPFFCKP